jgi:hypothetical protein
MRNSLFLVVSNTFMKPSEETALDTADHKLSGSDTSTLSWFGHMDQQDYSNFFTISTALDLPSNSQWKLKLMIPFCSWMFRS